MGKDVFKSYFWKWFFFFFNRHSITCGSILASGLGIPLETVFKILQQSRGRPAEGAETLPTKHSASFNTDPPHGRFRPMKTQTLLGGRNAAVPELIMTVQRFFRRLTLMEEKHKLPPGCLFHLLRSRAFLSSPSSAIPWPTLEGTGDALSQRKSMNDSGGCNLPDRTVL